MTKECISPLRRRMIEDMTVRHFASKTQHDYIRAVMKLAGFLAVRRIRRPMRIFAVSSCT